MKMEYIVNGTLIKTTISGDLWQTEEGYTISRTKKSLKGAWNYTVFAPKGRMSADGLHRQILCYSASSLKKALREVALDMKKHKN